MDRNGRDGRHGPESLIPRHGGYRKLKSFQVAQLVYDVTVRFCDRFIDKRSRTHDQMVQAARSGTQNIAEGSMASATSKKMELKLTNVAKASLGELGQDYEDFLRHRGLPQWAQDDPRRQSLVDRRCATADEVAWWVKATHDRHAAQSMQSMQSIQSSKSIPSGLDYAETSANAALVLVEVAISLLDRQLASLARTFETSGGFTERMYRTRQARRRGV